MEPSEFIYIRPELVKRTRKHFRDILQDSDCKSFVQIVGDYHEFIGPTLSGRFNARRASRTSFSTSPVQNRVRPMSPNVGIEPPPAFAYSPTSIRSWVSGLATPPNPAPPSAPVEVVQMGPSPRVRQAWARYGEGQNIERLRDQAIKEPVQFLEDVRQLLTFIQQDSAGKRVENWVEKSNTLASRLLETLKAGMKRRAAQLDDERRKARVMSELRAMDIGERRVEDEAKGHAGAMMARKS
jgi:hypothetical protein